MMFEGDWTRDERGRSNNSARYNFLVNEIKLLLRSGSAGALADVWAERTARVVMSHLAHRHGLRPSDEPRAPIDTPAVRPSDEDLDKLLGAAHRVWSWVGPGDPDLDDPEERDLFMRDVQSLASSYYYGQSRART